MVLQRGEECIEFGQMGALMELELVDLRDVGGEGVLSFPAWVQEGDAI